MYFYKFFEQQFIGIEVYEETEPSEVREYYLGHGYSQTSEDGYRNLVDDYKRGDSTQAQVDILPSGKNIPISAIS